MIRRIRAHEPRTRILVFSMHSDPIIVARALEAGATGYVLKDTSSAELLKAFEKVRAGTPYLSNDLAMEVALVRTGVRPNPLAELTPRELQTLSLLAEGKPYGRIAEELNVSYKTVVNVCSQLKQKLDARNLPELIRVAVQLVPSRELGRAPASSTTHLPPACVPKATLPNVPDLNCKNRPGPGAGDDSGCGRGSQSASVECDGWAVRGQWGRGRRVAIRRAPDRAGARLGRAGAAGAGTRPTSRVTLPEVRVIGTTPLSTVSTTRRTSTGSSQRAAPAPAGDPRRPRRGGHRAGRRPIPA